MKMRIKRVRKGRKESEKGSEKLIVAIDVVISPIGETSVNSLYIYKQVARQTSANSLYIYVKLLQIHT